MKQESEWSIGADANPSDIAEEMNSTREKRNTRNEKQSTQSSIGAAMGNEGEQGGARSVSGTLPFA